MRDWICPNCGVSAAYRHSVYEFSSNLESRMHNKDGKEIADSLEEEFVKSVLVVNRCLNCGTVHKESKKVQETVNE